MTGAGPPITERVRERRERFGFMYVTVLERHPDDFAPVIGEPRGT
ncbi:hypothetical protein [Streptomyces netropsis]|uniref:Uncharacterized protein n=1 Tax=Streptomyces netropsis TaxID=55404 RepID=A0A7W7LG04_STRNE|nr:hypothetical protein [Streptomyces netropsis]MBB4888931.1 hypothetical protein [Streptomyces netropsis]GGR11403.1 hypothetical protein GCM10010219_15550 [Streptomyces netropsis]